MEFVVDDVWKYCSVEMTVMAAAVVEGPAIETPEVMAMIRLPARHWV